MIDIAVPAIKTRAQFRIAQPMLSASFPRPGLASLYVHCLAWPRACRMRKTRPAQPEDPVRSGLSTWQNLTIDGACTHDWQPSD